MAVTTQQLKQKGFRRQNLFVAVDRVCVCVCVCVCVGRLPSSCTAGKALRRPPGGPLLLAHFPACPPCMSPYNLHDGAPDGQALYRCA